MPTLRNKRKLAAASFETKEHPGNSQSHNTSVPWITEEYIKQVSEETESRVIEKLSQNFNRTDSYICLVYSRRLSHEPAGSDALRNRSRYISEQRRPKLGTSWGLFPDWSPYRSGVLCLSVRQFKCIRPGGDLSHDDRRSRGDSLKFHGTFSGKKKRRAPQVS